MFDTLAVRHVGHALPYRKIALTSFISLSIGHNVGVSVLSSGALRYRLYSGFGLSAGEVGGIILFCALTGGLGLMSLGGVALLLRPDAILGASGLMPAAARGVGVVCLALVGTYLVLAWQRRQPVVVGGYTFRMPNVRIAAGQIGIGAANFAFVAAILHQLLAGSVAYTETIAAYVLGNITAWMSHVPGGLGVLEFVIASLVTHGNVIGALIAFRIVYFLVPLLLGSALLISAETRRWRTS
jgi:uncharacterized membrane protein YbhN (UPF0104 family)